MKSLSDYINEALTADQVNEAEDSVFAVKDSTGAILNMFPTKEEADADLKNWPKESGCKVEAVKKSEIEK